MAWTHSYSDARGCSGYEYDAAGVDVTPEACQTRIRRVYADGADRSWVTEYESRNLSEAEIAALLDTRAGT